MEELENVRFRERERIKELQCLYGVLKIFKDYSEVEEILEKIVNFVPIGWLYPEYTCCRIVIKNRTFQSEIFEETNQSLEKEIVIFGEVIGTIEVLLMQNVTKIDGSMFLKEEHDLIEGIANEIGTNLEKLDAQAKIRVELREKENLLNRIKTSLVGLSNIIENAEFKVTVASILDFTSENSAEEDLLALFEVLGNDNRFIAFDYLRKLAMNSTEIQDLINKSQSTTSHHLKLFRNIHLIQSWRQNNLTYFSINQQQVNEIKNNMKEWVDRFKYFGDSNVNFQQFTEKQEDINKLCELVSAFGNSLRFSIINKLMKEDLHLTDLEIQLSTPQSTLHHHISLLKKNWNLIQSYPKGKFTYYTLNKFMMEKFYKLLLNWLTGITNWTKHQPALY